MYYTIKYLLIFIIKNLFTKTILNKINLLYVTSEDLSVNCSKLFVVVYKYFVTL